jgi:hypothetical protein
MSWPRREHTHRALCCMISGCLGLSLANDVCIVLAGMRGMASWAWWLKTRAEAAVSCVSFCYINKKKTKKAVER